MMTNRSRKRKRRKEGRKNNKTSASFISEETINERDHQFSLVSVTITEYLGTKVREEETVSLKKHGRWSEWFDPVQNLAVFRRLTMEGHFWEEEGSPSSWSRWCCRWEGTLGRVCLPHVCVSEDLQGSGWLLSLSLAVRFPPTQLRIPIFGV